MEIAHLTIVDADRSSAVDRLVDSLRTMIREKHLDVGDALPTERELSIQFSAARNTVREALQVMRAYGIIDVKPKSGAVISNRHFDALSKIFAFQRDVTPTSFQEVQGFRKLVETGIGDHLIVHAREEDLAGLDQINRRILGSQSVEAAARDDFAFHEALVGLSGNRLLLANYRLLEPMILQIMRLGKEARLIQEDTFLVHAEIVEALRKRDRLAFAYLMSRHLDFGFQFIEMKPETTKEP
jgi:GntR family transcriptional regulator, transcriptional repressor for pyruvate dehydrogenase complex